MASYINPKVVVIPDPIGLDLQIAKCQAKLGALSWMQTVYGRAALQFEDRENSAGAKSRVAFPEVWGRNREPENVMPNDNLKAFAFFVVRDSGTFNDYTQGDQLLLTRQPVSCIVWANLAKIDPNRKYRFSEELKRDVMRQISKVPSIELLSTLEQVDRVFDPFTITDVFKQYLKPPYWAFRVDFALHFSMLPADCVQLSPDVPSNALLNEDGTPILDETGAFLLVG